MAPLQADVHADDYYQILGVDRTASEADVAKAYKRLALKHHPDKNPNNKAETEEIFKKISEAYSVLSDKEKRSMYDQFGKEGARGRGPDSAAPFFAGGGHGGVSSEEAEHIFRTFFGMPGDMPGGTSFVFMSHGCGAEEDDEMAARAFGGGFGGGFADRGSIGLEGFLGGASVVIKGLERAPEHNGKTGTVVGFDEVRGRYDVNIEGAGTLSLRPQNVTQRCEAELVGLESKPELNGRVGDIISHDSKTDRYVVLLRSPPSAMSLQRRNCILRPGTCVLLDGLSQQEYNGQMAQVLSVDRPAGRYVVKCRSGEEVKVKYDKVVC